MDKWTNSCRSCLKREEIFSYFIYEHISPEQYFYCTSVEVKPNDELTKAICGDCYNLINKFIEFKARCILSQNKLLRLSGGALLNDEPSPNLDVKYELGEHTRREKSENENNTEVCSFLKIEIIDEVDEPDDAAKTLSNIKNVTSTDAPDTDLEDIEDHIQATIVSSSELRKPTVNYHPKNFKCEQCNRTFSFKERFEGHMLTHEGKAAPIECKECNRSFRTWGGLYRHIESCRSRLSFKDVTCQVCSKVSKTPDTLRVHTRTHKEQRERVCDECVKSNITFKSHLQTHTQSERNLPCEHCGKKYINKTGLSNHIYRKHSGRQLICDHCGFEFTCRSSLIKHVKVHVHAARYKCELCQTPFTSHSSLVQHRRTHGGGKPFSCSQCPKSYKDKYELVIHERVHTGERPYKCPLCEMTFSLRPCFTRHVRRHNKRKAM